MAEFKRNLAVVIGINQYKNGLQKLRTAVNDATRLAEILEKKYQYNVLLLLDNEATLEKVNHLLAGLEQQMLPLADGTNSPIKSSDRVLFYFAGHGIALDALESEEGPVGYLVPQDARLDNNATLLPLQQLHDLLVDLPCRHLLVILDCCFAGAFRWASYRAAVRGSKIYRERYERFINSPAKQIITSATSDEKALDSFGQRGDINGRHSPFAEVLFKALSGEADLSNDGLITATELYVYLRSELENTQAKQTPGFWQLNGHDKGEYIFTIPDFNPNNLPLAPTLSKSTNPYRGLKSFDEEHSNLFFGRSAIVERLHEFVKANPLTIVLGASGAGKSSLVKAGLIPRLRQEPEEQWEILPPMRPGESPLRSLFQTLRFANLPEVDITDSIAAWAASNPQSRLILVIDQFEELITLCRDEQEREQFFRVVAEAIANHQDQFRVVVTLRSDFEPQFRDTALEPFWTNARFAVLPMTRDELRNAIIQPTVARVMYFEPPSLVDAIIDEVAQMPGALPLLSFALSELYLMYLEDVRKGERNNRAITHQMYDELGGVIRAIVQIAEQEYDALVALDPVYVQTIRNVMLRMVAVGEGELGRRQVTKSELVYLSNEENERVKTVIEHFNQARLIVQGSNSQGEPYVEPAHDAFIRGWSKLLNWTREEEDSLRLQQRLSYGIQDWISNNRSEKWLWDRDPRLDILKQVLTSGDNWLNALETEFVNRSIRKKEGILGNVKNIWDRVTGANRQPEGDSQISGDTVPAEQVKNSTSEPENTTVFNSVTQQQTESNAFTPRSRKIYALLVGIDNYPDPNHCLQGCINDITAIEEYVEERFDRQEYQLHLLKLQDEQATREAIINGFRNHLCQAQKDDVVLFYYSGHGSQELAPKEFGHIEPDHLDETLVCYDSRTENGWDLADKELALLIAEVAEKDPHITIILDCGHSGSGTRGPMQEAKERYLDKDKRSRPLDSFIFKLEDLEKLSDISDREKHPTGWKIPKGRHVLLAACQDHETAKEYYGGGKHRGGFSYFLMDTLFKARENLTCRDLFARTQVLVLSNIKDQSPQLEVTSIEDDNKFFLDGAITSVESYFIVTHDKTSGWVIEGGAVHGVQPPKNGETTLLALFPFDANIDDLYDPSKSVGTAKVTQVLATKSKIDIEGVENLTTDTIFKALVISIPLPHAGVYFEGDDAGVNLAREKLETAGNGKQPSPYIREEQEVDFADFRLLCRNNQYIVTKPTSDRPLVGQIDGYTSDNADQVIKRLEHIARWTTIAQLANTAATQIKTGDVKMELIFKDEDLSQSQQMRLQYKYKDGKWQPPEFKLKLTNTTKKPFYCALVNLSDSFSISAPFFESGSIRLQPGESAYALDGEELILEVPEEYWTLGITEYKDIIKLIVSNDEFDARLLNQDKIDAPRPRSRDIESANQSSFERLMDRTQNREIRAKSSAVSFDDWYAEEITITTVRPLESTLVSQEQEQQLGVGVKLQPHPSLVANIRLTTTPQVSRDLGNKILPPILQEDPQVTQPFQFTTSRGTDPGLSVLELNDVADHEVVTPDAPLKLLVDAPLTDNEYLLPIGYDGEFFLPLGRGQITRDGKTEIILERLPAPVSEGERSLQGAIRIFFQKVISQGWGREFKYPILAVPEITENQQKKVTYRNNEAYVREQVKNAKRIALYIHGIIGDTESLVSTIKQPVLQPDGQKISISELYDLVLTFDYENLNTSIEQNARNLKRQIRDVGLGENHGKELHIIAHSIGGLVSRWFIECEGGNQIVQHLVMLGTPNAGSPWPSIKDLVSAALGIGLNQLSTIIWPTRVIAQLLQVLEDNDYSFEQMKPDSTIIQIFAHNPDPHVPYTIIAGDRSVNIPATDMRDNTLNPVKRLMSKILEPAVNKIAETTFFSQPNDIAVTVQSINSIPKGRTPQPNFIEVACDDFTYFSSTAGLEALANVLQQVRSTEPEESPEAVRIKTRRWYFNVEALTKNLAVGEDLTLNLNFTPDSQLGSNSIRVPANTLELTIYIEASGFYLQGEHTRTLPVRDGELMERSLILNLTPLISGDRTINLSIYPGGRLPNLSPEKLPIKVRVNTPTVLPNIPELIDRRAIPAPEPDVILHVTLEEVLKEEQLTGLQRVGLYLTCPALSCDRQPLEPLHFTANELERLRQSAIQAAAVANGSPVDVLTSLQAIGATLFDRLMPIEHSLRNYYWELFNLTDSDTPLSWLIVSEAKTVLPWELVCAYYKEDTGKNWYDEFLAQKFILAHWVGYQGLKLINEAPLLKLGLTHYNQRPENLSRWEKVLGSEAQAKSNQQSGLLDLMQPSSSCYGLHILRYTDPRQTGQITSFETNTELASGKTLNQAEELLYNQRLDFTLRRPVVGLSLIDGQTANRGMAMSGSDNQLEADWMLPLMHAGASALVGSRWSVLPESDRLFYRTFYNLMRSGTELGSAVWQARKDVRLAFPHRSDWLAYTYFGHPQCQPYLVRSSQGFTFFEAINPPENEKFLAGKSYEFRASYRSEAPVWYTGRLHVREVSPQEELSVMVMPMSGSMPPETYPLEPVTNGNDYQCIVTLTMPDKAIKLPIIINFQKGEEELRSLILNLKVVTGGQQ